MSTPKRINDTLILQKANELVSNINSLSDELHGDYLYELKDKLKCSIANLPERIADGFKVQSRIEQIRMNIKANSHLEECKDYLSLLEKVRFIKTDNLKSQIEEISTLLISNKVN